jgi:hypothetical protein
MSAPSLFIAPKRAPLGAAARDWPPPRALRAMHLVAAAAHATWVACGAAALPNAEVGVGVLFRRTQYQADARLVLRSKDEVEFKFMTLRVLLAFPAATAAFHVAYALLPGAGARGNLLRWAEYAVSATLITLSALVACGVTDEDAFAFAVALSVGLQACGLGLDLLPRDPAPAGARETLLGVGFLNVSVLFWQIVRHAFTEQAPPGAPTSARQVSVAYGVYYLSFGVAAALRAYDVWLWRGAAWTEFVYVALSLSSKTGLFWISFAGVKLMLNFLQPQQADTSVDWRAVQIAAAAAPAAVAVAVLGAGALAARTRP